MDRSNIIGNLAIPYLCITARTSSEDCLSIHEDFMARMTDADEEIEREDKCIDDIVMRIKTSKNVCFSELSIDSIMKEFYIVTESILNTKKPVLMDNAEKLMVECRIYMKKLMPSVLSMSLEEWLKFRINIFSTVQNLEMWAIACLKIYEHDFVKKLFLSLYSFN